jgi:hypothetical protein
MLIGAIIMGLLTESTLLEPGSHTRTRLNKYEYILLTIIFLYGICGLYPFFEDEYEGGILVSIGVMITLMVCGIFIIGPLVELYESHKAIRFANSPEGLKEQEKQRQKQERKEQRELEIKAKKEEEINEYKSRVELLGSPTRKIQFHTDSKDSIYDDILFFDGSKTLLRFKNEIKYEDIFMYSLSINEVKVPKPIDPYEHYQHPNNQPAYITKTSTSNMVGRAVVGGLLTGGVGAVTGAVTAKKETYANPYYTQPTNSQAKISKYYYTVYVRLIDGTEIPFEFMNLKEKAERFTRELDYILKLNENNKKC